MDHSGNFYIRKFKDKYIFTVSFYSKDVKILYKIKKRFKTGKIIYKKSINILKITKNIEVLIDFFYKNKLLNQEKSIKFYQFSYLFQKNQKSNLSDKEIMKFNTKIKNFHCMI
jgi:hypothetical protein